MLFNYKLFSYIYDYLELFKKICINLNTKNNMRKLNIGGKVKKTANKEFKSLKFNF